MRRPLAVRVVLAVLLLGGTGISDREARARREAKVVETEDGQYVHLQLEGDPAAVAFPRPMEKRPGLDFSYSGLKTAVAVELERRGGLAALDPSEVCDIAASFEAAATDSLVVKARRALRDEGTNLYPVVDDRIDTHHRTD